MRQKETLGVIIAGVYFIVCIVGGNMLFRTVPQKVETQKSRITGNSVLNANLKKNKEIGQIKEEIDSDKEDSIYMKADETYFKDAVFIGDSRTEGFGIQSGIKGINCYAKKGLAVNTFFQWKVVKENGEEKTIIQALRQKKFKKIYIMLGYNELGWPTEEGFIKQYKKVIKTIKNLQKEAIVYVQSIIYVSTERSETEKYENNKNIVERNRAIKKMAEELGCHYLELNEIFSDKEGNLIEEASVDGVHLKKKYSLLWKKYLLGHVVKNKTT